MKRSWFLMLLTPVISYASYPACEASWEEENRATSRQMIENKEEAEVSEERSTPRRATQGEQPTVAEEPNSVQRTPKATPQRPNRPSVTQRPNRQASQAPRSAKRAVPQQGQRKIAQNAEPQPKAEPKRAPSRRSQPVQSKRLGKKRTPSHHPGKRPFGE